MIVCVASVFEYMILSLLFLLDIYVFHFRVLLCSFRATLFSLSLFLFVGC